METKLTLRLRKDVVESAKKYAKQNNTSLSRLVENYFEQMKEADEEGFISKEVQNLIGILKDEKSTDKDIKQGYYESRLRKHSGKK